MQPFETLCKTISGDANGSRGTCSPGVVLCCVVLCCVVLCCVVLCCVVLCCVVLCCVVLCCAVLCCAVLCCAVLCCAVLCCGAVRCGAVRCGAVRCGAVRSVRCGAVRCGAVRCGAVRCGAVRCGAVRSPLFLTNKATKMPLPLPSHVCWVEPFLQSTHCSVHVHSLREPSPFPTNKMLFRIPDPLSHNVPGLVALERMNSKARCKHAGM